MTIRKTICVAGKNAISVGGMRYIWNKYRNDYDIVAVCDHNDNGIDTWQPSLRKYINEINVKEVSLEEVYGIDLLVFISLEYHKLIEPKKFVTNKLYNIHFSLLPAYKGMFTSAHPILNNENISGCTFHEIDEGIDTGDIIFQKDFKINSADTGRDLYEKYTKCGLELIYENVSYLIEGGYEKAIQPSFSASYFSNMSINYNNLEINTRCTAFQMVAQIKAYSFRDYQLPVVFGKDIFGCKILDHRSVFKPGTIVTKYNNKFSVATVDYDVDNFEKLMRAVYENDIEMLNLCIRDNKFVINERNSQGWTPLIVSIYYGHNKITRILLESGAIPNKGNPKNTTPLMYAKDCAERTGDMFGLMILLEYHASVTDRDIYGADIFNYINKKNINHNKIIDLLEYAARK